MNGPYMRSDIARGLGSGLRTNWNLTSPFRWGVVQNVHDSPPTVDVFLDGSPAPTPNVFYLTSYRPSVGEVVAVAHMPGRTKTSYWVIGGLAQPGGKVAAHIPTVTVAASDSSLADQGVADFICIGSSDEITFQTAISGLGRRAGGQVNVCRGTYNFGAPIGNATDVWLMGQGGTNQDGAVFWLDPSSYVNGGDPFLQLSDSRVSGIDFQANDLLGPALIRDYGNSWIDHCFFENGFGAPAILITTPGGGGAGGSSVTDNIFSTWRGATADDAYVLKIVRPDPHSSFGGVGSCVIANNLTNISQQTSGFYIAGGSDHIVTGNTMDVGYGGAACLVLDNTSSTVVANNNIQNELTRSDGLGFFAYGIWLRNGCNENHISGNRTQFGENFGIVLDGSFNNQVWGHFAAADLGAILITNGAHHNNVQGVMRGAYYPEPTSFGYGGQVDAGCADNIVTNCDFRSCLTPWTDDGIRTVTAPGNQYGTQYR